MTARVARCRDGRQLGVQFDGVRSFQKTFGGYSSGIAAMDDALAPKVGPKSFMVRRWSLANPFIPDDVCTVVFRPVPVA